MCERLKKATERRPELALERRSEGAEEKMKLSEEPEVILDRKTHLRVE